MKESGPSQGAGASPGGGGGQGGAGEAAERVDVDEDVSALKEQLGQARDLIQSLNDISSGVRKGDVDPELLGRLDVARDPRGRNGEAFDRSKTEDKQIGVTSRDPSGGQAAKEDPKRDGGGDIHDSKDQPSITDTIHVKLGDLSPDEIDKLIESGKLNVSPEYRRIIQRYSRELSESK